jgi:hypothetical protein
MLYSHLNHSQVATIPPRNGIFVAHLNSNHIQNFARASALLLRLSCVYNTSPRTSMTNHPTSIILPINIYPLIACTCIVVYHKKMYRDTRCVRKWLLITAIQNLENRLLYFSLFQLSDRSQDIGPRIGSNRFIISHPFHNACINL